MESSKGKSAWSNSGGSCEWHRHLVFESADAAGNMLTLTDPTLNVTTWTYDAQNRVTSETNQTGYARSYVFDADGNMIQETDRDGRVITFTYDRDNRLLSENYSGSSIAFAYGVNGLITSATDSSSGTMESFAYDNLNRLIGENTVFSGVSGTLTQSWGYDRDSNITSYAAKQNGTTLFTNNYTYDALSELILLSQSGSSVNSKSAALGYDADSQMTSLTRYHDLTQSSGDTVATTDESYDTLNRMTSEVTTLGGGGGTLTLAYNQSYNIASQIIALATGDGTSDFTYDNDGQLQTVSAGAMPAEDYSYDASGNRDSTGYATSSNNQMTTAPSIMSTSNHYVYAYDGAGNTTDRYLENSFNNVLEHDVYGWDFRNRLTEEQIYTTIGMSSVLTQTINIGYDAFDERVSETVTNNTASSVIYSQRFLYDGDNLSVTVDASTLNPTQIFLNGLKQDQVFAQDTISGGSATTSWAITDNQGTVRDVVNNSGSVVDHNVYGSFGNIVSQSNIGNSILMGWDGMVFDTYTGYNYDNARWYDSGIGRFISVDPIGFKSGQKDLYVFCADNPINGTDPYGLWTIKREGHPRAEAVPDNPNDTIQSLADMLGFDGSAKNNWKWLEITRPKGMLNIERYGPNEKVNGCKNYTFTIPNVFVIADGSYAKTGTASNVRAGIASPLMGSSINALNAAAMNHGFNVVLITQNSGARIPRMQVINAIKSKDTWGYALFGHGNETIQAWYWPFADPAFANTNGGFVWYEDDATKTQDLILPGDLDRGFKYGIGINYHCYGDQQAWENISVTNHKSDGLLSPLSGPRGIGYWGSWSSMLD